MIYFGNATNAESLPDLESFPYLNPSDMSPERQAFRWWIVRCWLHDEPEQVPNDQEALERFDIDSLLPRFRKEFAAGGWDSLHTDHGIGAEEYILFLQLRTRKPMGLALNREQPQQPLTRVRYKLMMSPFQIGACLITHLVVAGERQPPKQSPIPVLLYDGHVGHVITARGIDNEHNWIFYDDPTWPGGKSMLCEGENAAGAKATYFGHPEVGQWMVHSILLSRLIYGIPIFAAEVAAWRQWAEQAEDQRRESWRHLFGEEPPRGDLPT